MEVFTLNNICYEVVKREPKYLICQHNEKKYTLLQINITDDS